MIEEFGNQADEIIKKAMKFGVDEIELYAQELENKASYIESNKLKSAINNKSQGVGIRVIVKNSVGFAAVNTFHKSKIEENVKKAIANAKVSPSEKNNFLSKKLKITLIPDRIDDEYENITITDCINYSDRILKGCNEVNPDIKIESGIFSALKQKNTIYTSTGISASEEKTGYLIDFAGMAVTSNEISTWDEEYSCYVKAREINIDDLVKKFSNKSLQNLGAKKTTGFIGNAILSPEATRALLRLVVESAKANNMQAKSSFLCDRLGVKVADSKLTIIEDGSLSELFSSRSFDREGIPSQENNIIDRGIFSNILYNTFTANKEGLQSTGNAGGDYREMPYISSTNIEVQNGENTLDELIKETKKGVLFNRISASPNPITGDFAAVLKGAKIIENGEVKNTLKEITAAGNIYEMIKSIWGITKEQKHLKYYQTWMVPFTAFENITYIS